MLSLEQNQRLISICSKKLEKNPYDIKTLLLRASSNIKLNSLYQAESDIYKIINKNPNSSIAYYLLGIISQKKKSYQQSLFYLTKSIELDPDNINAIYSRATVYNELNFFKKAIDDYYLALKKDSMKNNIYNNIAQIMGTINDEEEKNNNEDNYNNKTELELDAEINNYMYDQLKAIDLLNHKENIQYEFIESENNGSKNHKEKDNEVKEIYDPNEVKDENVFLFGQRNSNIDNIIKSNNKIKNIEEKENMNDFQINFNKKDNENSEEDKKISKNRYHNDGHIASDLIINEANLMVSKEEENENILNQNNKPI